MAFLNFRFKDKQRGHGPHGEAAPKPAENAEDEAPAPITVSDPVEPEQAETALEDMGTAEEMDLDQLVEALQLISEYLGDTEEEEAEPSENAAAIPFTLEQVSDLLTDAFDATAVATTDTTKMVHVLVDDVYAQLGRGRVAVKVSQLLAEVPPGLLAKGFDRFSKDEIELPLQAIVSAVQPAELEARMAEAGEVDLDGMPDLFASNLVAPPEPKVDIPASRPFPEPDRQAMPDPFSVRPAEAEAEERKAEEAAPEPVGAEEGKLKFELSEDATIFNFTAAPVTEQPARESGTAAFAEGPEDEPAPPAAEPEAKPCAETVETGPLPEPGPAEVRGEEFDPAEAALTAPVEEEEQVAEPVFEETEGQVVLAGLDLNTADAESMSDQLDGVGPRLAARIVRHREVNGPFRSVADLARVQGVGPSTYRKMTGKSWSEARDSLKRTLDYVLGTDQRDMPDLKAVARRIHSLSGFEGCVFAHEDGHMLASSWADDKEDALGAVAPQMMKKLQPYVEELDLGDLNPLTLFLGDTAICILQCGHVILATVHGAAGLGRRQTRLIELLGTELEQRFEMTTDP